jgi:hypothetical protein
VNLDTIARQQLGLVTRLNLLSLAISASTIDGWLAGGRLIRVHTGVYRLPGAPVTWHQSLLAAVLAAGPGAVASHRAAAKLWGLIADAPIEISVPRGRHPRLNGVIVHQTRDIVAPYTRQGVRVTSPMRALIDLGAVERVEVVSDSLERGLIDRRYTIASVEWARVEVARPGRRGSGVLKQILDERALGADRPDGLLEPRMAQIFKTFGLPPAIFQFRIVLDGVARWIDFAYPELKIAIEVDGWNAHATPADMQRNIDKRAALAALGWLVIPFSWSDVVRNPAKVARTILATRDSVPCTAV